MTIADNVHFVQQELQELGKASGQEVTLVAVTKYATVEQMKQLIAAGCKHLGESRLQTAEEKIPLFESESDIAWHFIGHLQKNKVKKVVPIFSWIQSVDSMELLAKIDTEAAKHGRTINVLLQVNIGDDPNKFGFSASDLREKITELKNFSNAIIRGIMTILPLDDNADAQREWFRRTRELYESCRADLSSMDTLSMGMSSDYKLAIGEGASMVRIGSRLITEE